MLRRLVPLFLVVMIFVITMKGLEQTALAMEKIVVERYDYLDEVISANN